MRAVLDDNRRKAVCGAAPCARVLDLFDHGLDTRWVCAERLLALVLPGVGNYQQQQPGRCVGVVCGYIVLLFASHGSPVQMSAPVTAVVCPVPSVATVGSSCGVSSGARVRSLLSSSVVRSTCSSPVVGGAGLPVSVSSSASLSSLTAK